MIRLSIITVLIIVGLFGINVGQYNLPPVLIQAAEAVTQTVALNTKSHKFHRPNCRWAIKCTVNCITLSKTEAIKRDGIPCKVCGGG